MFNDADGPVDRLAELEGRVEELERVQVRLMAAYVEIADLLREMRAVVQGERPKEALDG